MVRKQTSILLLGLMLIAGGQASATLGGDIDVNGFMSTGLSWVDSNNIVVNSGISDDPSSDKVTVFGLNFSGRMTDRLSFNAITVIRGREADPAMRLDTANIMYQISDTWRLRAGKIRAPIWLISDYLDVKALQPWARAPEEFYEAPFDVFAYDGLSLIKTIPIAGKHLEFEAFGGQGKIGVKEKRIEIDGDIRDLVGLSARLYGRNWQVKGSWSRADIRNHTYWDLKPASTTDQWGDPAHDKRAQTINPSPLDTSNMQFMSVGGQYDGLFFLWAEYGRVTAGNTTSQSVPNWPFSPLSFKNLQSYYVTPGYYFFDRSYLAHFTFSQVEDKEYVGIADGTHRTYTVGLNRYFGDNLVIKAAWGQTAPKDKNKDGLFDSIVPDKPVNVYDLTLNMTF